MEPHAQHRIEFLGWLEPAEIERELSSAWLLVAPSLWAEPLGLVALEAIVRGVPVLASKSGGFAETVEEGISGVLVSNGDVDAIASVRHEVAAGGKFSQGIPHEAVRTVAMRHDISAHVARMRRIFGEVVAAAR